MDRYLRVYRVISKTFGLRLRPLGTFLVLQLRQAISATTMGLDRVVFPRYKEEPIDRPIFIIGNPRSGTTFLHRFLLGNGGLAAFELWEMLFPAITARKLLGRVVPRFDRLSPARYHPSDVHDTSLRGIETDDPAWFFHTLDGPSRGPTSWPGRITGGGASCPSAPSGSAGGSRRRRRNVSSVTTKSAGEGTSTTSTASASSPRRACSPSVSTRSSSATPPTASSCTSSGTRSRSSRPGCRSSRACSRTATTLQQDQQGRPAALDRKKPLPGVL